MEYFYFSVTLSVILILLTLFFFLGKKEKYESYLSSSFECGFTSYFFSRFSFSIHFFLIALIFLFFDLELCCLMPFFQESNSENKSTQMVFFFVSLLLVGLLKELKDSKLEWTN